MAKKAISESKSTKSKKKKSSKKAGPKALEMKSKAPKENPFETIWSRRKFDILGKKRKGEERRVGLARSHAIEKRKKTLLKEYEQSGKSSVFLDKRIGEQNDSLGEFDKAILRSQRERQMKLKKKSKFNLSDGEDEFDIHDGGSFPERDDFDEEVGLDDVDDDDADQGDERRHTIFKQLNTLATENPDLTEGEENRPKSKKEVMEEIMLKSKFFKAKKAKDKEENEQFIEQLDKDFTSLIQSEALLSLTRPEKLNALEALVNQSIPKESTKKDNISISRKSDFSKQEKPDTYDKLVKELALEIRARPSDRTKTPEEIAEEERERLELLEKERQERMLATDDTSDEDDDAPDDKETSAQMQRPVSGDDLGDSFSLDEKPESKRGWVDEILERNDVDVSEDAASYSDDSEGDEGDEEGTDEANMENDENSETLKDWEQSEDDLVMDFGEDEEGAEDEFQCEEMEHRSNEIADAAKEIKRGIIDLHSEKTKSDSKQHLSRKQDLPYVICAPSSMEELTSLFENRSNEDIVEAIRRIRFCNPIKENWKKMQVFYGLLLQFFATSANKKPLNFGLLNLLVKPLMEMSGQIPYFSAICARERILRTRTQFCEDIKDPEKSSWPSIKTLFLLRLWSLIFPGSDFRHAVMTPAILLMCEYLLRCPILGGRDVAVGSFLCSMVLLVTKQSQKFCPEAVVFLKAVLMAAIQRDSRSFEDSHYYNLLELKAPSPVLCIQEHVEEIRPLDFLEMMSLPDDSLFFNSDGFRASMLVSTLETLKGFVNVYQELKAFPEVFLPISALVLEVAKQPNMPNILQDKLKDVAELIKKKADEHHRLRRPLQMRKQKPVPIKLLNPKFEENFIKGRDYDPDRERADRRKLNKLLKREAKGATRELRKDNYFLFEVKEREKAQLEEERAEKYGKARAFLQEQEHAFKSGQLGKGHKRRR
ncbi:hypothetical protein Ancab_018675 [Ancistrocladus abbreviatus]